MCVFLGLVKYTFCVKNTLFGVAKYTFVIWEVGRSGVDKPNILSAFAYDSKNFLNGDFYIL